MSTLFQLPKAVPISAGEGYAGAKCHFYQAGTTTNITTYTTAALSVPHANPVVADANGVFAPIFINEGTNATYKMRLVTSADVLIYEVDNLTAIPSQANIGATLWPRSAAEITAGVTPTNYYYEPGNVLRYGTNTTPGTTDMTAAFNSMIAVAEQMTAPTVTIPDGTYYGTDTIEFSLPDDSTICWYGTLTSNVSAKPAVRLGNTSARTYRLKIVGGINVDRTSDDTSGSSRGIELRGLTFYDVTISRCTGFYYGVVVSGEALGSSHGHLYVGHVHDNKQNLLLTASGAGFCNELNVYGGSYSHSSGYADFTGTVNIVVDHFASAKLNNICFYKPSLEAVNASSKAATIHGTNIVLFNPRLERTVSQSTYEIEFTANSVECCLIGKGNSISDTNITDSGANNIIVTRNGMRHSYQVAAPAAALPAATDPVCHRVKSTSSSSGLGYACIDAAGALRYSVDVSGKAYSNSHAYWHNGIRWGTTDGTYTDRGLFRGTGSPESVVAAQPGSMYLNSSGGASTTLYVKESGTGNTGWVAK